MCNHLGEEADSNYEMRCVNRGDERRGRRVGGRGKSNRRKKSAEIEKDWLRKGTNLYLKGHRGYW